MLHYEHHRSIPSIALRDGEGNIIGKKGVVDYLLDLYEQYQANSATVEDVAVTRSVFNALDTEKMRRNRHDYAIIAEKPGGRQKTNKIYTGLVGHFSARKVYLRSDMYELIRQIKIFGPYMPHDDLIESLLFAIINAFPPADFEFNEDSGEWQELFYDQERDWRTL